MRYHVHAVSGLLIGEICLALQKVPFNLSACHDLSDSIVGASNTASLLYTIVPTVAAAFTGAIFPDFDINTHPYIPHRTIFHWPYLYLTGLLVALVLDIPFLMIFCLAAIIHLALDAFNPAGIPLGVNPFGKKHTNFGYVPIEHPIELMLTLAIVLIGIAIGYLKSTF